MHWGGPCIGIVGRYELLLVESDRLKFVVIEDDCSDRANRLQGSVDLGVEVEYALVE
jgi:hypothetical protein